MDSAAASGRALVSAHTVSGIHAGSASAGASAGAEEPGSTVGSTVAEAASGAAGTAAEAEGSAQNLADAARAASEVHELVTCDGCGLSPIRGPRWKCNQCADFDLCDICYGLLRRSEQYQQYHIGEHTFRRMRNGKHPIVKCDNGDAYEDEWLNGKIHGQGICTFADGRW